MAVFLKVSKDMRTGKIINIEKIEQEALLSNYPNVSDILSWIKGARIGSKFTVMNTKERTLYARIDGLDEERIKAICGE